MTDDKVILIFICPGCKQPCSGFLGPLRLDNDQQVWARKVCARCNVEYKVMVGYIVPDEEG